jgi:hypothetical protein
MRDICAARKIDIHSDSAKKLRSLCGMKIQDSLWDEQLDFDSTMTPHDPSHLLDYGLLQVVLDAAYSKMSKTNRDVYTVRCRDFEYPRGWSRIRLEQEKLFASRFSMDLTRRAAVIATVVMEGLIEREWFQLVCDTVRLRMELLQPAGMRSEIERLQLNGLRIIAECFRLQVPLKAPNTIALWELLIYDLPTLVCLQFADSRTMEAFHQPMKRRGRLATREPEEYASKRHALVDGLRFVFNGGSWGSSEQHRASPLLLNLRDYRDGLQHRPHPLLEAITSHLPRQADEDKVAFFGAGRWRPMHFEWKHGRRVARKPSTEELNALQVGFDKHFPTVLTTKLHATPGITFHTPTAISDGTRALHVGDDVTALWDVEGLDQYARIGKFIMMTIPFIGMFLFYYPRWYEFVCAKDTGLPMEHPVSKYPVIANYYERNLKRYPLRFTHDVDGKMLPRPPALDEQRELNIPYPVENLREQVMIVHRCHSAGIESRGGPGSASYCTTVCVEHNSATCSEALCRPSRARRFQHHLAHDSYVVIRRNCGFF